MIDLRIPDFKSYLSEYQESVDHPDDFWDKIGKTFTWMKPYDQVCEWNFAAPKVEWFLGGEVNITENALDRHLGTQSDKIAYHWEPNDPNAETQSFTYQELHDRVCQLANGLRAAGIKKGDRIVLYMPMIPELAIACLAIARIGAIHSVVFAGFSAKALSDRIQDAQAKMILTSDGLNRGNKQVDLKTIVDDAVKNCDSIEKVVVFNCLNQANRIINKRDVAWETITEGQAKTCPPERMNSEDPLFILYTSGSTGKPKGVVHSHGGYMVYTAYSFQNVFQVGKDDTYWCTADIGWITGHSYIVYGPLLSGASSVMFEGIPSFPDAGRFWQVCEKYKVNQFYTAPTAIRALMAHGLAPVQAHDLSSLKVIGTVGEPINEEAWSWYYKNIGHENCPVVDTWWQTETGGIMISGLGDISPMKPCFAGYPLPGIQAVLLDQDGNEIEANETEGYLCIKHPWPSIVRTTYGDHERCRQTYFTAFKDHYFTGDGAKRADNGMYRIIGRVDDVINVSGHRFGTAEIEDAINSHPAIIESAVVGFPHEIKGQAIYAYVIADASHINDEAAMKLEVENMVIEHIGKIARPDKIQLVTGLPKTRSGKIMRRILRKIAEGESDKLGDISTLLDPSVVQAIIEGSK